MIARIPMDRIESTTAINDLAIKSILFVEIQVALEDTYQVDLDPIVMIELNVLNDVVSYIHRMIMNSHK